MGSAWHDASMKTFREVIESGNIDGLNEVLADDVVFRSPIVFSPYQGKAAVIELIRMVARVFEDFSYVDELSGDGGRSHALVFRTRVGDRELEGCDFLHYGDDGLVEEMFVMVRPLSAAHALASAMQEQLAQQQAG
jgi:hypothetical protein